MFASTRMLSRILDHMLQLLPAEPADSKRLDDIVDADAGGAALQESVIPVSGTQAKGSSGKIRAAS